MIISKFNVYAVYENLQFIVFHKLGKNIETTTTTTLSKNVETTTNQVRNKPQTLIV